MNKTTEHDYQVKIFNPFEDINIEVISIFHSLITNHCETKKLGDIYAETINNNVCFSYDLN